ncbi:MAG: FecR family protein [Burkholderiaceae bacterium]
MITHSARRRRSAALIALVTGAAALVLSGKPLPALASQDAATVVRSSGDTWLIRSGAVATPVTDAFALRAGDRVSTGSNGRVDIRYTDGTLMAMGPGSSLTIERFKMAGAKSESWFSLARGSLRTVTGSIGKLNPPGFQLRTPTAVMGVRGTDFSVWQRDCRTQRCDPKNAPPLELEVHSGRVVVATRRSQMEVPQGRRATVAAADEVPSMVVNSAPQPPVERPSVHAPARPQSGPASPTPSDGMHLLR